jgi:hypothetical protein
MVDGGWDDLLTQRFKEYYDTNELQKMQVYARPSKKQCLMCSCNYFLK